MEAVYTEVLYTITHKLGSQSIMSKDELYDFAQKVFQVSGEKHEELMDLTFEEKVINILKRCEREIYVPGENVIFANFSATNCSP